MGRVLNINSSCTTFYKANPNSATATRLQPTIAQPHPAFSPSGHAILQTPSGMTTLGTPSLPSSMGIHNGRQWVLNTPRRDCRWASMKSPQLRALLPAPSSENHLGAGCWLSFRGRRRRGTGHPAYDLVPHVTLDHLHI